MHLSHVTKFIIRSSLLLISLAVLGFAFIYISNNVRAARNELSKRVTEISLLEKNQTNLGRMSDLLQQRNTDIERLMTLAVNRDRPLQFIERTEQIGHITRTLLALSIDEARSTAESLVFRAIIDGNETSVRNMLRLIEALPYQITIENLSFQQEHGQDIASSKPNAHLNITMRVNAQ